MEKTHSPATRTSAELRKWKWSYFCFILVFMILGSVHATRIPEARQVSLDSPLFNYINNQSIRDVDALALSEMRKLLHKIPSITNVSQQNRRQTDSTADSTESANITSEIDLLKNHLTKLHNFVLESREKYEKDTSNADNTHTAMLDSSSPSTNIDDQTLQNADTLDESSEARTLLQEILGITNISQRHKRQTDGAANLTESASNITSDINFIKNHIVKLYNLVLKNQGKCEKNTSDADNTQAENMHDNIRKEHEKLADKADANSILCTSTDAPAIINEISADSTGNRDTDESETSTLLLFTSSEDDGERAATSDFTTMSNPQSQENGRTVNSETEHSQPQSGHQDLAHQNEESATDISRPAENITEPAEISKVLPPIITSQSPEIAKSIEKPQNATFLSGNSTDAVIKPNLVNENTSANFQTSATNQSIFIGSPLENSEQLVAANRYFGDQTLPDRITTTTQESSGVDDSNSQTVDSAGAALQNSNNLTDFGTTPDSPPLADVIKVTTPESQTTNLIDSTLRISNTSRFGSTDFVSEPKEDRTSAKLERLNEQDTVESSEVLPLNEIDTGTPIPTGQYAYDLEDSQKQNSSAPVVFLHNSNNLPTEASSGDNIETGLSTSFTNETNMGLVTNENVRPQTKNDSLPYSWKRICFQDVRTIHQMSDQNLNPHSESADIYLYYYIPSLTGVTSNSTGAHDPRNGHHLKHEYTRDDENTQDRPYSAFSLSQHKTLSSYYSRAVRSNETSVSRQSTRQQHSASISLTETRNQNIYCTHLPLRLNFTSAESKSQESIEAEPVSRQDKPSKSPDDLLPCTVADRMCADGRGCLEAKHWCDGIVDCLDMSDELQCSCKDRMAAEKLCDGYFDCPDGEDEVECAGCPKGTFVCDNGSHLKIGAVCVEMSKRCDNIVHCRDGKDEEGCEILTDVINSQAFLTSYTTGYLHRNWKGKWYPTCDTGPDKDWALKACSYELGFHVKFVEEATLPFFNSYQGKFISEKKKKDVELMNQCGGNYAVHVKCPPVPCGSRVIHESFTTRYRSKRHHSAKEFMNFKNVVEILNYITSHKRSNRTEPSHQETHRYHVDGIKAPEAVQDRPNIDTERVVGGEFSNPGFWPWVVIMYKNGKFHCGGVILDETWILTAAHCVSRYPYYYFEVQAGVLRRQSFSPHEQTRSITYVIIHPAYDPIFMKNDLALLRVNSPLMFNRWVRPICLPEPRPPWGPLPGIHCTAVGWGSLSEHGQSPDNLKQVELPILPFCKNTADKEGDEICAGDPLVGGKDTCQGDSGGPLLCRISLARDRWYVAGVVSHGEGCGRPNEPGAYTRVALFLPWLAKNTDEKLLLPGSRPKQECPSLKCKQGGRCIYQRNICDGVIDCLDAEDELGCESFSNHPVLYPYPDDKTPLNLSGIRALREGNNQTKSLPKAAHDENNSLVGFNDTTTDDAMENAIYSTTTKTVDGAARTRNIFKRYFNCTILRQRIPEASYCDGEVDCRDGTDEINCTCSDILQSYNSSLICDGVIHCHDSSDEMNCLGSPCNESQFYCYYSKSCIERHQWCDGKPHCPSGEDEHNCYAIMEDHIGHYNIFGIPDFAEEGILIQNVQGVWKTVSFPGYNAIESHDMVSKITTRIGFKSCQRHRYGQEERIDCRYVAYIEDDARMPWHANIYVNGEPKCLGLLVNNQWIMISYECCSQYNATKDYMVAVFRSSITMAIRTFHEQIISADYTICNEKYSIAHLSNPVKVTEQSRVLPTPSKIVCTDPTTSCTTSKEVEMLPIDNSEENCILMMHDSSNLMRSMWVRSNRKDCSPSKRCYKLDETLQLCNSSNSPSIQFGGIACLKKPPEKEWYLAANINSKINICSSANARGLMLDALENSEMNGQLNDTARNVMNFTTNYCTNGYQCILGGCISWSAVCDGKPDCREKEDEMESSCNKKAVICRNNTKHVAECACKIHEFACKSDGHCISQSRICDRNRDCMDGSDEPEGCATFSCAAYLNLTNPQKLCDTRQDCLDKSDEQPQICPSFCNKSSIFNCLTDNECIPMDFVCDGEKDCSNGEDERNCTVYHHVTQGHKNEGTILIRPHGKWQQQCLTSDFTSFDAGKLCVQFGFQHATHLELKQGSKNFTNLFINIKLNNYIDVAIRSDVHSKTAVSEPCEYIHLICE